MLALRGLMTSMIRNNGEQHIQLWAFLRFLLVEDKVLSLGNREHSWRWQKQ